MFQPRHQARTVLPVGLQTATRRIDAALIDITVHGARLSGAQGIARGEHVSLHLAGQRFAASVQWAEGDRLGLTFIQAVPPVLVERLTAAGTAGTVRGFGGGAVNHPRAALRELR